MYDLEPCFFQNLSILKDLDDADMLESFCKHYGGMCLDDTYEVQWEAAFFIFPNSRNYYKEADDSNISVFFDPLFDELSALSRRYEMAHGIKHEKNLLWGQIERGINQAMQMDSYDYGWYFYDGSHGRSRLVLILGCEFYSTEDIAPALIAVRDEVLSGIRRFQRELGIEKNNEESAQKEQEAA